MRTLEGSIEGSIEGAFFDERQPSRRGRFTNFSIIPPGTIEWNIIFERVDDPRNDNCFAIPPSAIDSINSSRLEWGFRDLLNPLHSKVRR